MSNCFDAAVPNVSNVPTIHSHLSSSSESNCGSKKHCKKSQNARCDILLSDFSPYPSVSTSCENNGKPVYDVFLGGSCGNTVWRRDQVIPYLEKRAITYYDPQRTVWSENMIREESVAKENSSLFLFVLDPATVNATSFLEIAHFAARRAPKLVVVFLGRSEWREQGCPDDLPDRRRTCDLLDIILKKHSVPVLQSIQEALNYIDEVIIGEKCWSEAMANPFQRLPYMMVRGKKALKNTANHVKSAWKRVRNGVLNWNVGRFFLIGACELLLVLAVHFFLHSLPFILVLFPLLAVDAAAVIFALLYCRYKEAAETKRRALFLQQKVIARSPLPIPGRAAIPCKMIPQQIQERMYKSDGITNGSTSSFSSFVKKAHRYDSLARRSTLDRNGYDVFLGCSSRDISELEWISQKAGPFLHQKGCTFTSELTVERHTRRAAMHISKHILYHIPTNETMLSGMVEVAYFLGHSDWHVTICVSTAAKTMNMLCSEDDELRKYIERRNECYQMAFCYLRDMAERRRCEVFSRLDEALRHIVLRSKGSK